MKSKCTDFVWVVVRASSGIPDLAEVFTDHAIAEQRKRNLVKMMDDETDAISLIQTKLEIITR